MDVLIALACIIGFGYFIASRIRASKKKAESTTSDGGGSPRPTKYRK